MRYAHLAVTVLVAGLMAQHAQGIELASHGYRMGAYGGQASLGAPACACPGYGTLEPGCCQDQPNCCTNVWDGYCQEQRCCGCWFGFGWPCCMSSKTEYVVVSDRAVCDESSGDNGATEAQPTAPMPRVKPLPKPPKPSGVSWVAP